MFADIFNRPGRAAAAPSSRYPDPVRCVPCVCSPIVLPAGNDVRAQEAGVAHLAAELCLQPTETHPPRARTLGHDA